MPARNNYFNGATERMLKARNHVSYCDATMSANTEASVRGSIALAPYIYTRDEFIRYHDSIIAMHDKATTSPDVAFLKVDTVSAVLEPMFKDYKFTVLNFASYKHPGGMFLRGSSAQEECLCHESNLYPILRDYEKEHGYYATNKTRPYKSLYADIGIYTPDVIFERDGFTRVRADVITCASPNFTAASSAGVSAEENDRALEGRIKFLFLGLGYATQIIPSEKSRALVLGAWGCGVFGQDPYRVGQLFKKYINLGYADEYKKIVFAILPGRNYDNFYKGYTEN